MRRAVWIAGVRGLVEADACRQDRRRFTRPPLPPLRRAFLRSSFAVVALLLTEIALSAPAATQEPLDDFSRLIAFFQGRWMC